MFTVQKKEFYRSAVISSIKSGRLQKMSSKFNSSVFSLRRNTKDFEEF